MLTRLIICLLSFALSLPALERRKLPAPAEFPGSHQSYPCSAGYAWFFADGKLAACHIAHEIGFGELTIPAHSEIRLTESGEPKSVFLAKDTRLGRYLCRGGERAWSKTLYPDGKLKTCWLAEQTTIDGIVCARAAFLSDVFGGSARILFDENGRLKSCKRVRLPAQR